LGLINVYRGQDGNIDYDSPVAVMDAEDTEVVIEEQDLPPNTIWHYVRLAVNQCCELMSEPSEPCIVRIGSDGNMMGAIPNPPIKLTAELLSGGRIRLRWLYLPDEQEAKPESFRIYIDSGGGFDFSSPADEVDYTRKREFRWTSGALLHGQRYKFCVRSRAATGESQNVNYVAAVADDTGPEAITNIHLTVEDE